MVDLDLDELERLWRDNRNRPGGTIAQEHVIALIGQIRDLNERVKRAEAENAILRGPESDDRDELITAPIIAQVARQRKRAERAEATITEAKLQIECDESGDAWRILATYQIGADHDD